MFFDELVKRSIILHYYKRRGETLKISVDNFKALKHLDNYDLKPLVIISGTNSGGKSSLIQLILLLKQSLESVGLSVPLILNKPYVSLGKYKDIIFKNESNNNLKVIIELEGVEIKKPLFSIIKGIRKGKIERLRIELSFSFTSNRIYIQRYFTTWYFAKDEIWLDLQRVRSNKYKILTNSSLFYAHNYNLIKKNNLENHEKHYGTEFEAHVEFNGLFPFDFDTVKTNDWNVFSPLANTLPESSLKRIFNNMSYLGPLRNEPHFYYFNDDDSLLRIGNRGEFAPHILAKYKDDIIDYLRIEENMDGEIRYIPIKESLENAVEYWICKVFRMAKSIKVVDIQNKALYKVEVMNNLGLKTPITHVGFGISQIFPIIVEGLRLKKGGTLILEQPEIHLHPKIQSILFDFLYSLILLDKFVIAETHSDHLITRLRRRVVENTNDDMISHINLTFSEEEDNLHLFKVLELSDFGTLQYWPKDFFDQMDKDVRAIVRAQARKRTKNAEVVKGS